MSLAKRRITVTFQLGLGTFGAAGANTTTISGHKCSALVIKAGGISNPTLNLRIWGMSLSQMNALSTLGKPLPAVRLNTVTVAASDDQGNLAPIFTGIIQQAWADMKGIPDSIFTVEAAIGLLDQMRPLPPTSINGSADVASVLNGLAVQMGYSFQNNGVSSKMSFPYYSGTGMDQVKQICQHYNINHIFDTDNTLSIWPKGGVRGSATFTIQPPAMVGFPTWTAQGLIVETLFNPSVVYGATMIIKSSVVLPTLGNWYPFKIEHDLASETTDGPWFTRIEANLFGVARL